MQPIIRWAGSKAKVLDSLLAKKPPQYRRYIEPFAGSASLFFALEPKAAILGDINGELIKTYAAVKLNAPSVSSVLEATPKTADSYYQLRATDPSTLKDEERAARFIFLMKSCFNGVYRTNKSGQFNVPLGSRIYAMPTPTHLGEVSKLLSSVDLVHGGFEETLQKAEKGDWVYVDPPYRYTSRFRGEYGYDATFNDTDLERLVSVCKSLSDSGTYVTFSYVEDSNLLEMLKGWNVTTKSVSRTVASFAGKRRTVAEIMISNH